MDRPPEQPELARPHERRAPADACRAFWIALGYAVKLHTLYRPEHPVPSAALAESWHLLHDLLADTGWPRVEFLLAEGNWRANALALGPEAKVSELLGVVFRSHGLTSLEFLPGASLREFGALCELAVTQAHKAYGADAEGFLRQRGVRHVRAICAEFVRAKRPHPPPAGAVVSPIPPRGKEAGARPKGFGSFIKSLVEATIPDPAERAQVYAEALASVKEALGRHVSQATERLQSESRRALNERVRAESMLAHMAEGRFTVDRDGRVLMMDPAAEALAGRRLAEVAGKPLLEGGDGAQRVVSLAREIETPADREISAELREAGDAALREALRGSLALVQDEEGRVVGTYAVAPESAKLREALRMQDEFVAGVTHELKTPLASICAALEILQDRLGKRLGGEESKFLAVSMRNGRVLRQMIDEILDFSRLQSGRMTVSPQRAETAPLLQEAVDGLLPWAQSKGLTLAIAQDALGGVPAVRADQARIVQVLNNLIANAVKHTEPGGSVVVSAEPGAGEREGRVVFSVRDTGCGIAPEDRERVFERFTQAGDPARRRGGVGLGLAIVRELVARHGGKVWLDSEPGKGSTFYFDLPRAAAEPPSPAQT